MVYIIEGISSFMGLIIVEIKEILVHGFDYCRNKKRFLFMGLI